MVNALKQATATCGISHWRPHKPCRESAGSVAITPTAQGDPLFPFAPEREGQSVDVTTSGGARTSTYKVQFVPPGLVRYVMPGVRPASWHPTGTLPAGLGPSLQH